MDVTVSRELQSTKKGIKVITHMFTPTIEVTDEVDRVLDFLAEVAWGLITSPSSPDYLAITREVVINEH